MSETSCKDSSLVLQLLQRSVLQHTESLSVKAKFVIKLKENKSGVSLLSLCLDLELFTWSQKWLMQSRFYSKADFYQPKQAVMQIVPLGMSLLVVDLKKNTYQDQCAVSES